MKTPNLEWRQQPDRDNKFCRQGCCRTSFPGRPCFNRYACNCHQPEVTK